MASSSNDTVSSHDVSAPWPIWPSGIVKPCYLLDMPSDTFGIMTNYLEGVDLLNLVQVFSKPMMRMLGIRGGVHEFVVHHDPFFNVFPKYLWVFSRIRVIRIVMPQDRTVLFAPHHHYGNISHFSPLLEILELRFKDAPMLFRKTVKAQVSASSEQVYTRYVLLEAKNYLPNLHSFFLACEPYNFPSLINIIAEMPDSLTHLEVEAIGVDRWPHKYLSKLPPQLACAKLDFKFLWPERSEENVDTELASFPPSLRTLILPSIEFATWPTNFPSSLTHFEAQFDFLDSSCFIDCALRFSSLQVLKLDTSYPAKILANLSNTMPELTTLHLSDSPYCRLPTKYFDELTQWPENLTDLKFYVDSSASTQLFKYLPRTLLKLQLHQDRIRRNKYLDLKSKQMKDLPPSLTYLDIHVPDLPDVKNKMYYPDTKKNPLNAEMIGMLPRSLTHSNLIAGTVTFIPPTAFSFLPANITSIQLQEIISFRYTDSQFALLPRVLTSLKLVGRFSSLSGKCLSQLPETLKFLHWKYNDHFTDNSLAFLPKGLEMLNMKMNANFGDGAISVLPRSLKSLIITGDSLLFTPKCFSNLPPMITKIKIAAIANLRDEDMKSVPHSVLHLEIPSATQLTNACAEYLPYHLQVLILSRNTTIKPGIIPDLPKSLRLLDLRENSHFELQHFKNNIRPGLFLLSKHVFINAKNGNATTPRYNDFRTTRSLDISWD